MDVAKHLFVIGAWAPVSSVPAAASAVRPAGAKVQPDSPVQSRPPEQTPSCSIPTCGKAGGRYMRAAGYGRPIPTTSSGAASGHTVAPKVGIEQRSGSNSKVNSSSSDDTAHAGEGHSKPVVARPGSSPQLGTAPTAPPAELPTVAEVLRAAKLLLQPTQAVERQFYADCYRACQVIPSSRPTVPAVAAPGSGSGGSGGAAPATSGTAAAPAQPAAYLSYVPEVALRLSCLGHRIVVRRVTDSKHYWSKSMTNMFCYCVLPGTGIGYVLDPSFKEHFRAGRMSDRYRDVWECLPPLFVGPPAKLVQLVQTLCAELQASFESGGRQLPPWRTFGSTINRWMSPCFQDVPVPPRRPMPPQAQQVAVQQQQQLLQQQQGPEQQQPGATRNTSGGDGGDSAGGAGPGASAGTGTYGGTGSGNGSVNGNGRSSSSSSSSAGMIPAAEAQAFLRVCEGLLAGTPSARARAASATAISATASSSAAGGGGAQDASAGAHRHLQQQAQHLQSGGGGEARAAGPGRGGAWTAAMRRVTGFDPRPRPPAEELGRLALRSPSVAAARVRPASGGMPAFGMGGAAAARQGAAAAAAAVAAAAARDATGPTWSAAAGPRPTGWGEPAAAPGGGALRSAHGHGQAVELGAAQAAGLEASSTSQAAVRGTGAAAAAGVGADPGGVGFTVRGADAAALAVTAAAAAAAAAAVPPAAPHADPHCAGPPGALHGAGRPHATAGPTSEQTRSEATQPPAADRAVAVARAPAGLLSRNLRLPPPP